MDYKSEAEAAMRLYFKYFKDEPIRLTALDKIQRTKWRMVHAAESAYKTISKLNPQVLDSKGHLIIEARFYEELAHVCEQFESFVKETHK